MTKAEIHINDYDVLTKIGLTKTQARCYALLNKNRSLTAASIALQLGINKTSLYGMLGDLRQKGFVTESHIIGAKTYRAVPLLVAMARYAYYQRQQIASLIIKQQSE